MPPRTKLSMLYPEMIFLNGVEVEADLGQVVEIKPVPAKPIGDLHSVPHYRCGVCNRAVVLFATDKKPQVCRWCGIPIDWE